MSRRKPKKNKKILIIIPIIIVLTLLFLYQKNIIFFKEKTNNIEPVITTSKNPNIAGTIIANNKETIEIITDNDSIYTINYNSKKYKIGDTIKIEYTSEIDNIKNKQDIEVINVQKIKDTKKYDKKVTDILNKMTLKEKIGQLLLVRVPDYNKINVIKDYNIGGYILFKKDFEYKTKEQVINEIKEYQNNSNIPLLIAVDEEGGTVSRLSSNKNLVNEPFLSPKELYQKGGFEEIVKDAQNKNNVLAQLGINLNLAPVADVVTDEDSFMYDRSFSKDVNETSEYIKKVVETETKEVSYALKHFPGYGNNTDTHTSTSVDNRSYEELLQNDLLPFKTGVESGVDGILVSHNIVNSIDEVPCSLSKNCHNIIRSGLNFEGVTITDALDMGAVDNYDAYLQAVLSGNNILIVTDYEKAFNDIYNNVQNGTISEELIDRLILKNLELKYNKELINESK